MKGSPHEENLFKGNTRENGPGIQLFQKKAGRAVLPFALRS